MTETTISGNDGHLSLAQRCAARPVGVVLLQLTLLRLFLTCERFFSSRVASSEVEKQLWHCPGSGAAGPLCDHTAGRTSGNTTSTTARATCKHPRLRRAHGPGDWARPHPGILRRTRAHQGAPLKLWGELSQVTGTGSAISTSAVKVSPSPIVLAGRRRCGAGTQVACHPSLMSGALRGSPQDLASTDAGTPAILPGQAPRDRERQRLPGFTPSRPVPARLTCRALARRTGPRFGHMPCYAEALSLARKGLYLRKLVGHRQNSLTCGSSRFPVC